MKPLAALLVAALLAGCAADRGYPSLAPRAAEKQGFDEPTVTIAPITPDPALDANIGDGGRRLDAIRTGYDADAARATRAAGATGARAVGSEAWLSAQTALAALDDWRSQASGLTVELESMANDRMGAAGVAYPALDALRARAAAEADREAAGIAAISARLPTG